MNRFGWWITLGAVAWGLMACDPKTPKPTDPPKPIAQLGQSHLLDELPR
jgi:hypothetical protein